MVEHYLHAFIGARPYPEPPFTDNFVGYSLMEDLSLSLIVARHWSLANVRTARIYHDSQSGEHKTDTAALSGAWNWSIDIMS